MVAAGLDVARINLSHGTRREVEERIRQTREAARASGRIDVAVMLDTRGPEIRVGDLAGGRMDLAPGGEVKLVPEGSPEETGAGAIPVNYPGLTMLVRRGDRVLLDDGNVVLTVKSVEPGAAICTVTAGGPLLSRKGVTLPRPPDDLPILTEADEADLTLGLAMGIDCIAVSFVRDASDILEVRRRVEQAGSRAAIMAKIENSAAVANLPEILKVSDAVMVARGDLGVELPPEEVPILQKEIIARCNEAGLPVVTATQMLESMIERPRPTRAEASDVANAILDGSDAVMLSAETSIGKHPAESVRMMAKIAARTEQALDHGAWLSKAERKPTASVTDAISFASTSTAHRLGAAAIVIATQSGYTARMMARHRPVMPLVAATPDEGVARRLALVWGVRSVIIDSLDSIDEMRDSAVDMAVAAGWVDPGDLVVFTAGVPIGVSGTTNLLQVHTIGRVLVKGTGMGHGSFTGTARIVTDIADGPVGPDEVAVCRSTDRDLVPIIENAGALVVEEGGLTSHGAIVGLHLGVPTVVGASGAVREITDGETITVDGARGLIYSGQVKVG